MIRHLSHLPFLALMLAFSLFMTGYGESRAQSVRPHAESSISAQYPPVDLLEAQSLCDAVPLQSAEGIWEIPSENMSVLIMRAKDSSGNHPVRRYAITVIDTPDVRLQPGDTIGWLESSGDPKKFAMTLYTHRNASSLMQPARLLAELSSDEDSFRLKAEKWSVKFNISLMLKSFWRIVKLQHDNPLRNLAAPMVRLYPKPYRIMNDNASIRYL